MADTTVSEGNTHYVTTQCGKLRVVVNFKNDKLDEVQLKMGKSGACAHLWTNIYGKFITFHIRNGNPLNRIIKQLDGHNCAGTLDGTNCATGLAKVLKEYSDRESFVR